MRTYRTSWQKLVPTLLILLLVASIFIAACGDDKDKATPTPATTATPVMVIPTATPMPTVSQTDASHSDTASVPQDDAPHSNTRIEWWYYNGHLETPQGNRYAFHYVMFQSSVAGILGNIAHLSVSDPQKDIYSFDQRMSPALPVPKEHPGFAFDLTGWKMSGYNGHDELSAFTPDYALDLTLEQEKPPVLHQGTGLVSLGEDAKSYYYSRTRLAISGTINVHGTETTVTGLGWFDHQWGNFSPLSMGWDWFDLQLSDGSDIMLNVGRQPYFRFGSFVMPDGTVSHLAANEYEVLSTESWASSISGAVYPSAWRIKIPARGIDITVVPVIQQCEFDASSTTHNYYWEGEVMVSGNRSGRGFVELTGYSHN